MEYNTNDNSSSDNILYYTDRRDVLIRTLKELLIDAEEGRVQSVGVVALMSNGDVHCQESYKNNTDRLALIGATQLLSRHIMESK
jgi:hypothetical protein|tara:strand:- start:539 stop:793 length:255 start_codon:yes stop_codon:yes gene_type:complete